MEAKSRGVRECSVRLWRCDRGRGPEAERRSATLPESCLQNHATEYTETPLVAVKIEFEAEDVTSQEWNVGLPCLSDHTETDIGQSYGLVIKTEEEAQRTAIKEELDVGPTVLQPQSAHRYQVGAGERPGPGGAAPAFTTTEPNMKVQDNHHEVESRVQSCSGLMLDGRGTDYGTQEGHHCTCCVGPQSERCCGADASTAEAYTRATGQQYHCEHCNYYNSNRSNLSHVETHMDKIVCENARPKRSGSRRYLDILGKVMCHSRHENAHKRKRRKHSASSQSDSEEYRPTKTGEKPCKCEGCEYSTCQLDNFKRHICTCIGDKIYKCEQCEYSASHVANLKKHIRTHTGEKPYKCEQCEYSSSRVGDLKKHIRTHTGEKPYKCEQCEYSASHVGDLKKHIRTHTGEKPYKCKQCEYSASESVNLKRHMHTHTGEKPYKCEQCAYSSYRLDHFKTHTRTHTGEKLYKCERCEYSASRVANLKKHIRTHTGEKQYNCKQCEYSTFELVNLKRHIRTHTGEKL